MLSSARRKLWSRTTLDQTPPTHNTRVRLSVKSAGPTAALYLSPCSYINKKTPPLFSQSSPPDCMSKSAYSIYGGEKTSTITDATDVAVEPSLKRSEQEANKQKQTDKRSFHSKKPSLLCRSACLDNSSDSSPFCSPTFSAFFQDNSKAQEESSSYTLSLLEPASGIQKLRHSFHLPQLLPLSAFPLFFDSPSFWLASYFALNLSLTLYNKSVLIHFPFPYTLTALHAFCGTIGASILLRLQGPDLGGTETTQKPSWSFLHKIMPHLNAGETIVLLLFSMLYTINIVVSNASLRLVTVPVSD